MTPQSTASLIKLNFRVKYYVGITSNVSVTFITKRLIDNANETTVIEDTLFGSPQVASGLGDNYVINYLDSPGTTGSVKYNLYYKINYDASLGTPLPTVVGIIGATGGTLFDPSSSNMLLLEEMLGTTNPFDGRLGPTGTAGATGFTGPGGTFGTTGQTGVTGPTGVPGVVIQYAFTDKENASIYHIQQMYHLIVSYKQQIIQ